MARTTRTRTPAENLPIGALARRTGVKAPTIRYYEGVGLLPPPPRTDANRRSYGPEDERRLHFIRHARDLGFDIEAIRQLLALAGEPQHTCADADAIARAHLADVEAKIVRLEGLRDELRHMIAACACGRIADCRVIEALADHGRCLHEAP